MISIVHTKEVEPEMASRAAIDKKLCSDIIPVNSSTLAM
jgi:hypothetical protein